MRPFRETWVGPHEGDSESDDDEGSPWLLVFAEHAGPDVRVRLWGDLDASGSTALRRELDRVARALVPGATVSVDATRLTFVDTAGIRALDEARRAVKRSQGRFRLTAGEPLQRLLELSGMTDLLVDS